MFTTVVTSREPDEPARRARTWGTPGRATEDLEALDVECEFPDFGSRRSRDFRAADLPTTPDIHGVSSVVEAVPP